MGSACWWEERFAGGSELAVWLWAIAEATDWGLVSRREHLISYRGARLWFAGESW
jgi:hypothetical protein